MNCSQPALSIGDVLVKNDLKAAMYGHQKVDSSWGRLSRSKDSVK